MKEQPYEETYTRRGHTHAGNIRMKEQPYEEIYTRRGHTLGGGIHTDGIYIRGSGETYTEGTYT